MPYLKTILPAAALFLGGCGHHIMVPPRLDLAPHGRVGLVLFTVENAKGALHEMATRRFVEEILDASPGMEVLELGSADSVLRQTGDSVFGAAAARAMASRDVPVVFAGHLRVSDVRASGGISPFAFPHFEATVQVQLTVGLYSTATGGTLWRGSATRTEKVGELGLIGGMPFFSARDPDKAYGRLVDRLVEVVTRDLRPTWRKG